MAKNINKVSFSKAVIDKDNGKYVITEYNKDDSNSYDLSKILDKFIGIEGISIIISSNGEIEPTYE